MQPLPLRLRPGEDLRRALEAVLARQQASAAFVLQGIGSLSVAQLRLAGAAQATEIRGDLEILTLAGSLAPDGAHLHMSIADAQGACARRPCRRRLHRAHHRRDPAGGAARS